MIRRYALSLLALVGWASLPAYGQVDLKWKWEKDNIIYVQTVSTYKQTMILLGEKEFKQDLKQELEQTTVLSFKVKDKEKDGTVVLLETVEGLLLKTATGSGQLDDKVKGATLEVRISPAMDVKISEDDYKKMMDKLGGDDIKIKETIKAILTKETLEKSAREALQVYLPKGPVKALDTWEKSLEVPLGPLGTLEIQNKYKYEGKGKIDDKDYDKISYTSDVKLTLPKNAGKLEYQIVKGTLKTEDAKGTVYFDSTKGQLVRMESNLKMTGTVTLSVSGQNVDAKIDQEQKTTVTVTDKNPILKP